jgi:hypothetical protein
VWWRTIGQAGAAAPRGGRPPAQGRAPDFHRRRTASTMPSRGSPRREGRRGAERRRDPSARIGERSRRSGDDATPWPRRRARAGAVEKELAEGERLLGSGDTTGQAALRHRPHPDPQNAKALKADSRPRSSSWRAPTRPAARPCSTEGKGTSSRTLRESLRPLAEAAVGPARQRGATPLAGRRARRSRHAQAEGAAPENRRPAARGRTAAEQRHYSMRWCALQSVLELDRSKRARPGAAALRRAA